MVRTMRSVGSFSSATWLTMRSAGQLAEVLDEELATLGVGVQHHLRLERAPMSLSRRAASSCCCTAERTANSRSKVSISAGSPRPVGSGNPARKTDGAGRPGRCSQASSAVNEVTGASSRVTSRRIRWSTVCALRRAWPPASRCRAGP